MSTHRIFLIVTRKGEVTHTSAQDKRANVIVSGKDPETAKRKYLDRINERNAKQQLS